MPEINYFAVAAGALATFVVGGLWYSPALFGKAWQRETGLSDEQLARGNMLRIFGVAFVLSLVAAFVFALFLGPRPSMPLGLGAGINNSTAKVEPNSSSRMRARCRSI